MRISPRFKMYRKHFVTVILKYLLEGVLYSVQTQSLKLLGVCAVGCCKCVQFFSCSVYC